MNPALAKLYQEVILSHHRAPHHFGPLQGATHRAQLSNPLCGDEVIIAAILDGDHITACQFEGHGCALCRASASLLTDAVSGQSRQGAAQICEQLLAFLNAPQDESQESAPAALRATESSTEFATELATELGDLAALSGVREYPSRRRCATLPWEALVRALDGSG